jgi:hypothetical protein
MHNSITAEVAPGSSPRFSILRSAEIMASGFLVSSTDPASASSSRDRDSASLTTCDNSQASRISTTAMMMTMTAPPPPLLLLSEEDEDDEDDEEDDDPLEEFQLRLVNIEDSSPKKPTTPAMIRDHHQLRRRCGCGELVAEHGLDFLVVQRLNSPW